MEAFKIKSVLEFNQYTEIEEKAEDLAGWLAYYAETEGAEDLAKKLQDLSEEIHQLRRNFQQQQLKQLIGA